MTVKHVHKEKSGETQKILADLYLACLRQLKAMRSSGQERQERGKRRREIS
jgi:hypothetical protein